MSNNSPDSHRSDVEQQASSQRSNWYDRAFGSEYLALYQSRTDLQANEQVEFATEVLGLEPKHRILDLCCGAGRHLEALHRRGFDVVGLDRSADLIAEAATRANGVLELVTGDMRSLPFECEFDFVLSFFTSFGYFPKTSENFGVMHEISRVLHSGGDLLMDLMNRQRVTDQLVASSERHIDGKKVNEKRWITASGRVEKKTTVEQEGLPQQEFLESVQMYSPSQIKELLKKAGFELVELFGDFSGSVFDAVSSDRMIVRGRKC